MDEKIETIDSSQMEILSEFLDDEENSGSIAHRLGVLGNDFIIASQTSIAKKPQGKVIPQDVDERTRAVFIRGIKHDWWRGSIVFELKNFDAVLERIEEIYGVRPAREIDLNELEIESGKDKMGIRKNSVMPHNVGKPIVTLQISNTRRLEIDGLELGGWDLYVSPETGEKLMIEMQKIEPFVKAKLQTNL
jgi:hypothetical protein